MQIYTNAVLTVIALALVAIIAQQAVPRAKGAFNDCGEQATNPCFLVVRNCAKTQRGAGYC